MRLIDADALKKHILEIFEEEVKHDKKWAMGLKYSIKIIDNAPTVEERPQGEWKHYETILNDRTFYITECPFCKLRVSEETNFCPNCGADMRGVNYGT